MRKTGQDPAPALALLSGLLSGFAFAPVELSPLVFVAPVPLLWALGTPHAGGARRRFLLGWAAGFLHFLIVLHWILGLPNEEVTIPGLMTPALLFLSAYLALFSGAAAALAVWVSSRLRLPLGLAWAAAVTLAEVARSRGELAFPWGSSAYALHAQVPVLQFTSVTGFWGLVLWVALIGGLLYEGLRSNAARRAPYVLALGILFAAPWVHGALVLRAAPPGEIDGPAGLSFVLIQPNTSREIKWDPRFRDLVVGDLLDRTRRAAEGRPDLIVWPETAAPIVLLQEPVHLARVCETVRSCGIPLLAGTLDHRLVNGEYVAHNSAALIDANGEVVDRYDKRRLVPFSERMPFQRVAPWLMGLNFGQSDFSPGDRDVLFPVAGRRIGCLICYESIFPEMARGFVASGAEILVNITNDFWFGDTAAPIQHAEMAVFRAVETRTPLLRCANTGVSMVVDSRGRVFHRTGTFVEAFVSARVAPPGKGSYYVRHGEWLARGLLALVAALVLCSAFGPRGRS
jgi:apolipoprotein N-acyltransferase